jgi:ABC-type multidrug transport system fused ATPase/permease subunit
VYVCVHVCMCMAHTQVLFYGTIKENIALCDSEIEDEKVEGAARAANAHQFIHTCMHACIHTYTANAHES